MELDEESRERVTITTQQGLYQYTRLPFGVASAPAIFQRAMDEILQGLPGVICHLHDILITGRTAIEHHERLEEVMRRLQEHGTQLKREKCTFCVDAVQYLGYRIDSRGVHTTEQKVQTLVDTPAPKNVRSFLGMLNFYAKFIPNLATLLCIAPHRSYLEVVTGVQRRIPRSQGLADKSARPRALRSRSTWQQTHQHMA